MADRSTAAPHPPGAVVQPRLEDRGSTTIADKVIERLARRFAVEVPGVVQHSTGGPGPLGSTLPRSSVERAGDRARVALDVAVSWEASALQVAADVRDSVGRRLADQTGTTVDRVDVTVAALIPQGRRTGAHERRRVQ